MDNKLFILILILFCLSTQKGIAGENNMNQSENPVVAIETTEGTFQVELWADKAPTTVKNFLDYVEDGFYNGTIFHRVIDNFMIQGGGLDSELKPKETKAPIKNEAAAELKNERGTIAMARTNVVNSATSQFFINVNNNDFLNHKDKTTMGFGYAVFGKVIKGMDVVDRIKKTRTNTVGQHQDVPAKPIVIENVHIVNNQ
jgi:cyclophilin family peptidyl-prolyl cis-trans isomerase